MIYMFLSNNPSSGDINSSNLSCLLPVLYDITLYTVIRFNLVSVAEQAGLSMTSSETPKTFFSRGGPHYNIHECKVLLCNHECKVSLYG